MGLAMKRSVCAWLVVVGMMSAGAGAQTQPAPAAPQGPATTLVEPPTPLLPTDAHLVADDAAAHAPVDEGNLAAILAEDGLKHTETRAVIANPASPAVGWVRAYQFGDATGAFSAFTSLRSNGKRHPGEFGRGAVVDLPGGETVFYSGVSIVRARIQPGSVAVDPLLIGIQTGLPKIGGRRGLAPLLPTLLPKADLDSSTMHYALGPIAYQQGGGVLPTGILAWNKSAEVTTATYRGRAGNGTLTLLLYPTPQIAGDQGRAIEQTVKTPGTTLTSAKLRRIGPLLGMTSGDFTDSQAAALLASLHLNTEVSFDKPMPLEFHAEIRKTATLLQQIAVFTGVGILAALVLGVFLGGARAGIRVLQGKPAASEPEFLRIDLRGQPQPFQAPPASSTESGKT